MQIVKMKFCALFSLVFESFLVVVTSFNVDSYNYASFVGPETSMFGFSVAIHKESNYGWLIVGAPEAQSSYQQRVYRGGAVYKCPIDRDGACQEIPFDTKDDNIDASGLQMDNKTEQWFGATVASSGRESGPIVACAPRYTWFPKRMSRRDPVGTCYVSNGAFNHFNEYSPCRTFQWGYHRQGSCQAGFSAAINKDGDRLFIGSPGSWYWQGQMFSVDAHAEFKYKPLLFNHTYGAPGQVHQQSLETRPAVFSTVEGTEKDDDSYMGYSTIVGDFIGNGEQGIAVGMPRGNDLKGKVLLFTWNLTNFLHHFSSDQIGSYYGYALAASDVDGDGFVDLIVGAPMYTVPNNEGKYDIGRIYVIYHKSDVGKFAATYVIDGFQSKSRFGQALASLGDINQDGYGDFAVGAPYDGPTERGAVYIYHGSSKGVRKKFSQVIFAEDIIAGPRGALTTFGFSITGGIDLDGNEYPDMAIGAYSSNKAFFFRSRPVVKIESQVKFLTPRKEIDLKLGNYNLRKGGTATRTNIDFCVKYHGKGIPQFIDLDLQYILDSKKPKSSRMGFVENENLNTLNDTIRLFKDRPETCVRKEVYIKSDIRDKLTPLVAEVKYWMQEDSRSFYVGETRNPRSQLRPILDLNSPPSRKDSISVHKECGNDNICIPDLKLNVKSNVDQYLLGSSDNLTLDIIVSNLGEDSFETTLEVKYPPSVYYSHKDDQLDSHVLCNTYDNNILRCEIGNPIPKNKVVRFKTYWQPSIKEGMDPSYEFDLYVNSTNQELSHTKNNNNVHVSVSIWSNSTLDLSGLSHPADIYFNSSLYHEDISIMKETIPFELRLNENVIGPQVTHVYYLRNEGPATIEEAELFFIWPSFTLGGEDFLYLLEPPRFSPDENVRCDSIVANHLNFNIDRHEKSIWERLHLETEESKTTSVKGKQIESVAGGGVAKADGGINVDGGDGSFVHLNRQNNSHYISTGKSGTKTVVYPGQTVSKTSTKHITTENGVSRITVDNRTEITNGSGTFVIYNTSGGQIVKQISGRGYQHNLQNAGSGIYHGGTNENNYYQQGRNNSYQSGSHRGGSVIYSDYGKPSEVYGGSQQGGFSHGGGMISHGSTHSGGVVQHGSTSHNDGTFYQSAGQVTQQGGGNTFQQSATYGTSGAKRVHGGNYAREGNIHHQSSTSHQSSRGSASAVYPTGHTKGKSEGSAYGDEYDEYEDEEEEEEEQQSISGYYDANGNYISRGSTQRQSGETRDPKTYGKYGPHEYLDQIGVSKAAQGKHYRVATLDLGDVGADHRTESYNSFSTDRQGYSTHPTSGRQRTIKHQIQWSETHQVPPTHFNTVVERDNVPTQRPEKGQRYYGRKKRQTYDTPYPDVVNRYPCKGVHCTYMRCVVERLEKDKTLSVALRSRINARVLRNVSTTQSTTFSSIMAARISKLPYIGQPKDQDLYFHEITSNVPAAESEIKPDVVPLWVVVLSAVAGTIILLLLVLLLYKAGFFKRNRPSSAPERQPLNRNGYNHGDEAL